MEWLFARCSSAASRLPAAPRIGAGAQLDVRPLEGDVETFMQRRGPLQLLDRDPGLPLGQRSFTKRVGERCENVGVPGPGGDPRQRLGAGPGVTRSPRVRRRRTPPSAGPRRRSGDLRSGPAIEHEEAVRCRPRPRLPPAREAPRARRRCRPPSRRRRDVSTCQDSAASSGSAAVVSPRKARIDPSTPSATSASSAGGAGVHAAPRTARPTDPSRRARAGRRRGS